MQGYEVKGVDVSYWQGKIDWKKVKDDGINFAILRCGFGSDIKSQDDKTFSVNVSQCEKHGIEWGTYLYSYATNLEEVESEVQHMLRLLKEKKPTYPVYINMEDADGYKEKRKVSSKMCADICELFCRRLTEEGYIAGIYANKHWFETKLNDTRLKEYEIWLAQWAREVTYKGKYEIWQYSSTVKVAGINGNVDMNYSYKNYPKLLKEQNSENKEKETPEAFPKAVNVGDSVRYSGRLYSDSYGAGAGKEVSGTFKVSRVIKDRSHGVLFEGDLGWVKEKDCIRLGKNDDFILDDKVRLKKGIDTFYNGIKMADFLKNKDLYIRQIEGNRVLISTLKTGDVTGWVFKNDVSKI